MKDKNLKKAFDSIKLDDSMKTTMLENINKKINEENLDTSKLNNTSYKKERGIFMNFKKSGIALASCAVLIGGFIIYNKNNDNLENNMQPPASSSPLENEQYVPDKEFSEFDINIIKESVVEFDIRNHTNDSTFITIDNKEVINELIKEIENANEKDMSNEVYESIASSQADGDSVTVRFLLKNGSYYSFRANLDLDLICVNDTYLEVSPNLCNILKNQIKDIENFNNLNAPAPGM